MNLDTNKPQPSPRIPRRGLVFWSALGEHLRTLYAGQGLKLSYEDLTAQETGGNGLHLKGGGSGGSGTADIWFPTYAVDDDDGPYVTIEPGTFNGVYPTIVVAGTPTSINAAPDDRPKLFLTGRGLEIIILKPTFTLTVSNGWVTLATLSTVVIDFVTTEGDAVDRENTSGVYKLPLAAFQDGVLISHPERASISGHVCAEETGDGTGVLELTR